MAKKIINARGVITSATKVLSAWHANPELFAEAHVSLPDFEARLQATAAASSAAILSRTAAKSEKTRLKQVELEQRKAAALAREAAEAELRTQVDAASSEETRLALELSRLANGLKYTAKAKALSDTDDANDAAAKRL